MQALALQPPLHVGEREHDGVDLAVLDPLAQRLEGQVAVVGWHGPSWSSGSAEQAAQQGGRVVAVFFHGLARPVRPAVEHGSQDALVLPVRVGDVGVVAPGSQLSISCRLACTRRDRLDDRAAIR